MRTEIERRFPKIFNLWKKVEKPFKRSDPILKNYIKENDLSLGSILVTLHVFEQLIYDELLAFYTSYEDLPLLINHNWKSKYARERYKKRYGEIIFR